MEKEDTDKVLEQKEEESIGLEPKPNPSYTGFHNPFDSSWWSTREMGSPKDPYNDIPKLDPSKSDYQSYLTLEKECYSELLHEWKNIDAWEYRSTQESIKIYRKIIPDSPIACFRGTGIIHSSAELIRLHLAHVDLRKYWDPLFLAAKYYYEITPELRISQFQFKAPWPIANRDFVIIAGEDLIPPSTSDPYLYVLIARSIDRPEIPLESGFIRGTIFSSGFVIQPLPNTLNGIPQCEVTYIVQGTPNGWIPNWVVDMANSRQPLCIFELEKLIEKSKNLMVELLDKLYDVPEPKWNKKEINLIFERVTRKFAAPKELLEDPITFFLTGTRFVEGGKGIGDLMANWGKKKVMIRLWKSLEVYAQTVPDRYEEAKGKFEAFTKGMSEEEVKKIGVREEEC